MRHLLLLALLWPAGVPAFSQAPAVPALGFACTERGGVRAAVAKGKQVVLWDVPASKELATLPEHSAAVTALAISGTGYVVAVGCADGSVKLWDIESAQEMRVLPGKADSIRGLAFDPASALVAGLSETGGIHVWDVWTGQLKVTLVARRASDGIGPIGMAFGPDGGALASWGESTVLIVWDLARGETRWIEKKGAEQVSCAAFSPDGKSLAVTRTGGAIEVLDATTGARIQTFAGPPGAAPLALAWQPDGKALAVAGADRIVKLWDPPTGKSVRDLPAYEKVPRSLAFTRDGKTLAAGTPEDGHVVLRSLDAPK